MAHADLNLFCSRIMLHWILLSSLLIWQIFWILSVLCLWTQVCHQFCRILLLFFLRTPDVIHHLNLGITSPLTFFRYGLYSMLLWDELLLYWLLANHIIRNKLVARIGAWAMIIDDNILIWWLSRPKAKTAILFTWISGLGGNILLIGSPLFLVSLIDFFAVIKMKGFVRDILNSHWLKRSHCLLFTFFIKSFAHFWLLWRKLLMLTDDCQLSSIHLRCMTLTIC